MKEELNILFEIPDDLRPEDLIQVYSDNFTGTIDYDTPMVHGDHPSMRGYLRSEGFGNDPWGLTGLYGYAGPTGRWDRQRWGDDPWGNPPAYEEISIAHPRGFGVVDLAVRTHTKEGTTSGDPVTIIKQVISTDNPRPTRGLRVKEHDRTTGQITMECFLLTE